MKTHVHRLQACLAGCALLLVLPLAAIAADLYVSASGTYDGKPAYVDLQAAIDASSNGDTIWVEDGFICSTGKTEDVTYGTSRILISKAVTVRSRSGTLENPAVIRGAWHDPDSEIALGANAVRCVRSSSSGARLIGFRLEGGATRGDGAWSSSLCRGGGYLGNGILSNCLVVANQAVGAGGVSGSRDSTWLYRCIVTNNYASENAGGIMTGNCYDTLIVDNSTSGEAGGFRTINAWNCVIAGNHAVTHGGGGTATGETLTDCVITNNTSVSNAGGIYWNPTLVRCLVGWNTTAGNGGGVKGGSTSTARAYDSTFIGNTAGGSGGGAYVMMASNCTFTGNFARGSGGGVSEGILTACILTGNVVSNAATTGGNGGGFATGVISNSLVASNHARGRNANGTLSPTIGTGGGLFGSGTLAVNCVVSNNVSESRGGGMNGALGYNNIVIDNHSGSEGGGVFGGTHYNTLILGNIAAGSGGGVGYQATLYNCTVLDNTAPAQAGVKSSALINTITWNNTGGADSITAATNSCGLACTDAVGPGNTRANPKIVATGPYQNMPGPGSPCLNRGLAFAWMTDRADIRSRDRNGRRRVIDGRVDMGALEAPIFGTMLTVR